MSLTLLYIVIARSVSDVAIRASVARQSRGDLPEIPSPAKAGSE
jgi:hypothetical protein